MSIKTALLVSLIVALPGAAQAAAESPASVEASPRPALPPQLDAEQRAGYRAVFASIRDQKWQDAQLQLAAMKPGPLHAIVRAELLTAKGSPKADLDPLMKLLADAPELPQAKQIASMAASRGGVGLPPLPEARALTWIDGAPARKRAKSLVAGDMTAAELAIKMQPLIKADNGAEAQALLEATPGLTSDSLTEWQRKIAWMYFLAGDDNNARAMAAKAAAGYGDFAVEAVWVGALAAWRQHDCAAAGAAFESVAARARDTELRAAGLFWAARADMQCGRPDRIENRLKNAAQYRETFYGLLARQSLGIKEAATHTVASSVTRDWQALERRPNIRVAAALVEIGENDLADEVLKQQARIGDPAEFPALVRLTAALDLPADAGVAVAQRPGRGGTADRGALPRAELGTRWRLARRQGLGVRTHPPGIAFPHRCGECGGRVWPDAGPPRCRDRYRPQAGPQLRPIVAGQAGDQFRGRAKLSRAIARPALHRRIAAQGDRGVQCRAGASPGLERPSPRWRRSFALHRIDPVLGNARVRHHRAAQLLGV